MAFQGSLRELPLPDVLQLVAASGKTGKFTIKAPNETGYVFLRDGQIAHAQVGRLQGEEAVYELAIWPDGDFSFEPGETPLETTIEKSNTNLLMEAARRIDEWQVLAKKVPSIRLVPELDASRANTSVSLKPAEWRVTCQLDGRRSIEEVAGRLEVSPFEVAKTVYGMVTAGLVQLREHSGPLSLAALKQLNLEQLHELAIQIRKAAEAFLIGYDAQSQVQTAYQNEQSRIAGGSGHLALLEFATTCETAISTARGPNQARSFVEAAGRLLSETQGGAGAAAAGVEALNMPPDEMA